MDRVSADEAFPPMKNHEFQVLMEIHRRTIVHIRSAGGDYPCCAQCVLPPGFPLSGVPHPWPCPTARLLQAELMLRENAAAQP